MWVWVHSGNYVAVTSAERNPSFDVTLVCIYREWDAGGVLIFPISTPPTSACATMKPTAAPERPVGTCQSTRLILRLSRQQIMSQAAPGGSPATTGRSLQRQLWRRRNSSCGLDETTTSGAIQLPTPRYLPGPRILLGLGVRWGRKGQLSFLKGLVLK